MAYTSGKWDGSASNYKDSDAYCAACLIDSNPDGKPKTQDNCKLPVKEPDGDVNTNALSAALGALNGARNALADVSPADKKAAAKKLLSYYNGAKLTVPDSLKRLTQ
jgi:hypothetical protein